MMRPSGWAPFRSTKAAVKLHTLLDLRGNIPSFIFISDGKLHDVNILDQLVPEPGAIYIMDRGYIDFEVSSIILPVCRKHHRPQWHPRRGCGYRYRC